MGTKVYINEYLYLLQFIYFHMYTLITKLCN